MCLLSVSGLMAQEEAPGFGSLSTQDIEFAETRLTLQTMAEENKVLRQRLEQSRDTVRALTHSLALANDEAEVFRRLTSELQLRMEALGLGALDTDRGKLEQRLLAAVRDMQLENEEKLQLRERLAALTEAIVRFLPSAQSSDAEAHMSLEAEIRASNEALGFSGASETVPIDPGLMDGMVVSVKEDLSLVVMNIGEKQGVKVGMPFTVWRGEEQIASLRVIDVRKRIAGAVIQRLRSEKENINVGDRLRVETR